VGSKLLTAQLTDGLWHVVVDGGDFDNPRGFILSSVEALGKIAPIASSTPDVNVLELLALDTSGGEIGMRFTLTRESLTAIDWRTFKSARLAHELLKLNHPGDSIEVHSRLKPRWTAYQTEWE
jgi:hypothetical protein